MKMPIGLTPKAPTDSIPDLPTARGISATPYEVGILGRRCEEILGVHLCGFACPCVEIYRVDVGR